MNIIDAVNVCDSLFDKRRLVERKNPMVNFDDEEFKARYRATKETIRELSEDLQPFIHEPHKSWGLTRIGKLLMAIRFYATGSIEIVLSDYFGVSQSTPSQIITEVTDAICKLAPAWIKYFDALNIVQENFYNLQGFPRIVGCIDCTQGFSTL